MYCDKFPAWHIDGNIAVKSILFLDSTDFWTLSVKIKWQYDVYFKRYKDFVKKLLSISTQWIKESFEC